MAVRAFFRILPTEQDISPLDTRDDGSIYQHNQGNCPYLGDADAKVSTIPSSNKFAFTLVASVSCPMRNEMRTLLAAAAFAVAGVATAQAADIAAMTGPKAPQCPFCNAWPLFTSDRRRTIRRPPCVTLQAMSPGSPRHASLGLVRGFNKPLGDYESCVSLSGRLHETSGRPRAARPAAVLGSQLSALS